MKIYINNETDPYFNLASEQYLLDNENDDAFMLWRNERSVIIGRNQNAFAEINRDFTESNGIKVVRRLTGGGAVFHDLGNLNFTFITSRDNCGALDFARFSAPIIKTLRSLGIPAELSGRNDILADGKKISGNAQCVYNGKVMHHGTLLFSADLSGMSGALNVDEEKIKSKGIKSVRSRVGNIKDMIPELNIVEFMEKILSTVDGDVVSFSAEQIKGIEKLRDEKYSTWEWNFGKSKQYSRVSKKRFPYGTVSAELNSDGGFITEIRISGDFFGIGDISAIEKRLAGCRLSRESLIPCLSDIDKFIMNASCDDIISLII